MKYLFILTHITNKQQLRIFSDLRSDFMSYYISGPGLVKKFRSDIQNKFSDVLTDDTITSYIYHCNARNPRYNPRNSNTHFSIRLSHGY